MKMLTENTGYISILLFGAKLYCNAYQGVMVKWSNPSTLYPEQSGKQDASPIRLYLVSL